MIIVLYASVMLACPASSFPGICKREDPGQTGGRCEKSNGNGNRYPVIAACPAASPSWSLEKTPGALRRLSLPEAVAKRATAMETDTLSLRLVNHPLSCWLAQHLLSPASASGKTPNKPDSPLSSASNEQE